jgi:hypothetical protein
MISAPTPPTDNLYKFLALTGLIITGISIIYPSIQLQEIQMQMVDVEIDSGSSESALKELEAMVSNLEKRVSARELVFVLGKSRKEEASRSSSKELDTRIREFNNKLQETKKLLDENAKRTAENLRRSRKLKIRGQWLSILHAYSIIGTVSGLIMSGVGFTLWYRRVQVFLDKKAKMQIGE